MKDISEYIAASGRMIKEDGSVINIADIIEAMKPSVVKEYFSGNANTNYDFTKGTMRELVVMNDGNSSITVTVGDITMTIAVGEWIDEKFAPFTSCTITSNRVPFRAYGRG